MIEIQHLSEESFFMRIPYNQDSTEEFLYIW